MTADVPQRRLHERVLLAAADVQGDTPIGPVPMHQEDELDEFIQIGNIDRVALIGRLWNEPSSRTFAEVLIDVELDQELALTLARALKARCVARE